MSLDITLTDRKTGEEIASMNWLRNPYGLCNWAEANYRYATKQPDPKKDLHYVINHWNYEKSSRVNRALFKQIVDEYWRVIKGLEKGYFFFDVWGYIQFIQPNLDLIPQEESLFGTQRIVGAERLDHEIGIPMEYFADRAFHLGKSGLDEWKAWFQ
jgi:hypothetical protein